MLRNRSQKQQQVVCSSYQRIQPQVKVLTDMFPLSEFDGQILLILINFAWCMKLLWAQLGPELFLWSKSACKNFYSASKSRNFLKMWL